MTAAEIVAALGGEWRGGTVLVRCPAHSDRTPSLAVREVDGRALLFCHGGCEQTEVIAALRARGLWHSGADRLAVANDKRLINVAPAQHLPASWRTVYELTKLDDETTAKIECARRIWQATKPAQGTLAETYLRGRGITAEVPPSLRYHANLKHGPTSLWFPALVAGVQNAEGNFTGIHRTYLKPDGGGKAQVENPKMALGAITGGAVRLALAASTLGVAEGIETALSCQQATCTPCWAALSAPNLKRLKLPELVRDVVIFADGDDTGERAAQVLADRLSQEGRRVRIARPPCGFDFNDVLTGRAPAQARAHE